MLVQSYSQMKLPSRFLLSPPPRFATKHTESPPPEVPSFYMLWLGSRMCPKFKSSQVKSSQVSFCKFPPSYVHRDLCYKWVKVFPSPTSHNGRKYSEAPYRNSYLECFQSIYGGSRNYSRSAKEILHTTQAPLKTEICFHALRVLWSGALARLPMLITPGRSYFKHCHNYRISCF